MKKIILLGMLIGLCPLPAFAAETAKSIIQKVDNNRLFKTEEFQASMSIVKGKQILTKHFRGYGLREGSQSVMEFTNAEDKGVKYLKLGDELWIYFPDADDIMKISGHMLRQGMMGSDISYEDMLEKDDLEATYTLRLLPDQKAQERDCYVVELTAKKPDATYEKQVLYVDQERFVPLELEMYARGGRLLKKMSQTELKNVDGYYTPMKIIIQDLRKKNSETTVTFTELKFDQPVPEKVFTKAYLKK